MDSTSRDKPLPNINTLEALDIDSKIVRILQFHMYMNNVERTEQSQAKNQMFIKISL